MTGNGKEGPTFDKCIVEECEVKMAPHAQHPMCKNCRANIGHWRKRKPTDLMRYQKKLRIRSRRMMEVTSFVPAKTMAKQGARKWKPKAQQQRGSGARSPSSSSNARLNG